MNVQPRIGDSYRSQLPYVVLVPVFFIVFCFLYDPFGMQEYYRIGKTGFPFHFIMLTCILAAVLAVAGGVLWAIDHHFVRRRLNIA